MVDPSPPRVLHCIYDDPRNPWVAGGGAVRVFEIYRRLASRLASVTVVTGSYPGSRDETIEGIRYLRLGASRPYFWSRATYTAAASRFLRTASYDVAIFDFSTYVFLLVPAHRPVGFTVHHVTGAAAEYRWGARLGGVIAWQEAMRLRRCRTFSVTSTATERRLRSVVGPYADVQLVMAGVPDELFALPRADAGYLLYFGRLDWHQKGLDVLLEAIRLLSISDPSVRLKIAGRGKDAARMVQAARNLGIVDNIQMVGPVGDPERNRLLSGASVLMMPSRFEGFGMVAAEAMAAGVPIIASNADSLPEVVDPPRGGLVVPAGDAGALAAAVQELMGNPARRAELSRGARVSAERFRWDRIADQHLAFIETIRANHANQ